MLAFIRAMGRWYLGILDYFGSIGYLGYSCFKLMFRRPLYINLFWEQIFFLGSKSLWLIVVTALSIGSVMALQFGYGFERFGAKLYVPKVVALAIVRELGPVFTCLMLAGRVGSGIASELGSMQVTQQIDAMRALGTSPLKRLLVPRVLALIIIAPICTVIADIVGIIGGLLVATTELKMTARFYLQQAWEILEMYDLFMGTGKTIFFGLIIALTACHYGFRASGGTQGVGEATTRSVVMSSVMIFISDFVLSKVFWLFWD